MRGWLNSNQFTKTVVQPVVQQILNSPHIRLVRTTQGEYIPIKDAVVPVDDSDGKLFDMLST